MRLLVAFLGDYMHFLCDRDQGVSWAPLRLALLHLELGSCTLAHSESYIIQVQGEETIVCVDTLGALIMPRCINWASQHGQKTRNNFLADHFLFFGGIIGEIRCPKDAKNGLLERWRALSDRHRPPWGAIVTEAVEGRQDTD